MEVPFQVFMDVITGSYVQRNPVPSVNLGYIVYKHGSGSLLEKQSEFNPLFLQQLALHLWSGAPYAKLLGPRENGLWRYRLEYPQNVLTGYHGSSGLPCFAVDYISNFNEFKIINAFPSL